MVTVARKFTRYRDDADNDYVDNVGDGYHDDYVEDNGKDVCCEWKPLFCFCSVCPLPPPSFYPNFGYLSRIFPIVDSENISFNLESNFHFPLNRILVFRLTFFTNSYSCCKFCIILKAFWQHKIDIN